MLIKKMEFDGQPHPVKCPCDGCDEAIIVSFLPLTYRMRCMTTNEPFDIQIRSDGSTEILRYRVKIIFRFNCRVKASWKIKPISKGGKS